MTDFSSRKIIALERVKNGQIKVYTNKGDVTLMDSVIVKYHILKDHDIDDITWSLALNDETQEEAIGKACRYLALQTKSERQVYDYLMDKGYDDKICRNAITFLKDHDLVNDESYVKYCVDKYKRDLKGPLLLKTQLEQTVSPRMVSYGLSLYTDSEQEEILKSFMDKKLAVKAKSVISKQKLTQSLMRSALSKGFNSHLVRQYLSHCDIQESQEALEKDYKKLCQKYHIDVTDDNLSYDSGVKIKQALLRKGYSYQDIKNIMQKSYED